MRTAVLGWGSLIWDQRELRTAGGWRNDGPLLPLEFARLSASWPLTLVIHPPSPPSPALWALSKEGSLDEAMRALARREGCSGDMIGRVRLSGERASDVAPGTEAQAISRWATERNLDAVVWTALPSNFQERTGMPFNMDNAIAYLRNLGPKDKERAREYIVNAPPQVRTPLRQRAAREMGW